MICLRSGRGRWNVVREGGGEGVSRFGLPYPTSVYGGDAGCFSGWLWGKGPGGAVRGKWS